MYVCMYNQCFKRMYRYISVHKNCYRQKVLFWLYNVALSHERMSQGAGKSAASPQASEKLTKISLFQAKTALALAKTLAYTGNFIGQSPSFHLPVSLGLELNNTCMSGP